MLNSRWKAESRAWSSGATTLLRVSTLLRVVSRTLSSGVKSSLRACECTPLAQGVVRVLGTAVVFGAGAMLGLGPPSCVSLRRLSEEFLVQVLLALFAFGFL